MASITGVNMSEAQTLAAAIDYVLEQRKDLTDRACTDLMSVRENLHVGDPGLGVCEACLERGPLERSLRADVLLCYHCNVS